MSVIIDSDNNNVNITEEPINVTVSLGGPDVAAVWGGITGDITEQEDLQAALDGKVPYTGATGDVNLGEYGIQLGNLEFDNTPTNLPTAAGSVYWSDTDGTLNMVLKGGQTISRIGETQHIRALNNTGTLIARGKVVYVVGAQGQRLTIALADADTEILSKDTIGFTSEAIADGAEGFVIVQGVINNISTTGMSDGATVYLSQTAGGYTTTPPVDPAHLVVLGFIVNGGSGGAGSIYVKVDNGYELGELHDVNTTGATNGQVLTYNGTTWVPTTNGSGTVTSIATSAPITGGTITTSGTIGITQAGAAADGYLSSLDWNTFNNKQAALTLTTTGTSGAATLVGSTLNIPQYQGVLTNPVTGTGTAGQVSYWSGTNTQTGSQDFTWNDTTKILSFSNGGTLINEIRISSVNSNTMMGRLAGSSASLTGGSNSFFGQNSGSANTTGNGNSAFGLRSGNNNTTGSGNVFFGSQAGRYLADGTTSLTVTNNSVFLGFDTRAAADSQTNQIAIGYQAIGLGSNTTVIGNSSTTQTWLGGNLTLGTTTSGGRLTVRGSGTTSSTTALLVQNSGASALMQVTDDGQTTLSPTANTSALVSSTYNVTGSGTTPLINLSGTWNTTGLPSLITSNITDTASNAFSNLMLFRINGTQVFRVTKDGGIYMGDPAVFGGGIRPNGLTLNITSGVSGSSVDNDFNFGSAQGARSHTSGTSNVFQIRFGASQAFAPTSGTGVLNVINIPTTINQTGGANGITRGLYLNPTLTAAADWRGIESVAASNANHTLLKLRNATVDVFTVKADSKIGFYNATPAAQATTGIAEAAFVENSGGTAVNVDSTFAGYTLQQIAQALKDYGLLA